MCRHYRAQPHRNRLITSPPEEASMTWLDALPGHRRDLVRVRRRGPGHRAARQRLNRGSRTPSAPPRCTGRRPSKSRSATGCSARPRASLPMVVLPGPLQKRSRPDPLEDLSAERIWVPRPGPAFVMTAAIMDIPRSAPDIEIRLDPVRLPRLGPLPLHDCAVSRHQPYVLWVIAGTRYVCDYGDPCP